MHSYRALTRLRAAGWKVERLEMLEKRWSTSTWTSLVEHYDKFHIREQGLGLLA